MGKLLPVLAVLLILGSGVHIFREPEDDRYRGILIPCYIFLFSTFLLLCEMRIYPKSLRKMGRVGQTIIEFFIAYFIMEITLVEFWIPLITQVTILLVESSLYLEDLLQQNGVACDKVCEVLGSEKTGQVVTIVLSIAYLIAVLHATRDIDLRLLRCGVKIFFEDTITRLRWYLEETVAGAIFGNADAFCDTDDDE